MRILKWAALVLLVPLTIMTAQAQTTILERDRSDRQAPAKLPTEQNAPIQPTTPATNVAPFEPFVLRQVQIEGSTLTDAALSRVTSRYAGKNMDRANIDALTKELNETYAKSDVALYTIFVPNQRGENGILRIVVVEGWIDEVLVSGDDVPRSNMEYAQKILAPLINEKPLHRSTMERALALLSSVPGLKAEPRLLKTDKRGVVKLNAVLHFSTFEGGIGIGTRGSAELGRTQGSADVSINSLLRRGDRTTFSYSTPLDFEHFRYYSMSHTTPVTADGLLMSGALGHLITQPEGGVEGKATTASLQLSYPYILSFKEALSFGLGIDGLNSDNGFLGQTVSSDWTRAVRLSASYISQEDDRRFSFTLSLSHGIDALGARTSTPQFSDLSFFKANATVGYSFPALDAFVVRLNASGQYTNDNLPSSEQASLGGELYGRAFDSAVATGDKMLAASAELAYPINGLPTPLSGTELYAFVDGGALWREARAGFDGSTTDLSSAGIGARATIFSKVTLGVELARELSLPDTDPGDKDWRVIFSLASRTSG